jgi:DNA-binding response OmpR family regulator
MDGARPAPSLLVVEDDQAVGAYLADNLAADGFRVASARGAAEALRAIEVRGPYLVLLDLMLGEGNGLSVLDRVRAAKSRLARRPGAAHDHPQRSGHRGRPGARLRGADDYVVKPFAYAELLARIRAVLRRAVGRPARGLMRVGELTVDPVTREVRLGGRPVTLAAKEFALLQALAADPARVHLKNDLLRDVWCYASIGTTRTLDAHACRLRRKLSGTGRPFVLNVRGVGYRLTEAT